jgi:hypothetical protein
MLSLTISGTWRCERTVKRVSSKVKTTNAMGSEPLIIKIGALERPSLIVAIVLIIAYNFSKWAVGVLIELWVAWGIHVKISL